MTFAFVKYRVFRICRWFVFIITLLVGMWCDSDFILPWGKASTFSVHPFIAHDKPLWFDSNKSIIAHDKPCGAIQTLF